MTVHKRTIEEVKESTRYGHLYRIKRICGNTLICQRVRRRGDGLFVTNETKTIERTPHSKLVPVPGDLAFMGTDGVWSLWNIEEKPKENT